MNRKDAPISDEIPDVAVIQFGNYVDRLLCLTFIAREKSCEFSLNASFDLVLKVLKEEWAQNPFLELLVQNPATIDSLLRAYHHYNLIPLPQEPFIRKKIVLADQFYRYLDEQFSEVFRGSQLVVVTPTLEDYTRDSVTGELLPPLGLMDPSQIHPSDRAYLNKFNPNKKKEGSKKRGQPSTAFKKKYSVHRIQCGCCNEWISCPVCALIDLLRGWNLSDRTIALCYNCGSVFYTDTGELLAEFNGNRDVWGAKTLALIGTLSIGRKDTHE